MEKNAIHISALLGSVLFYCSYSFRSDFDADPEPEPYSSRLVLVRYGRAIKKQHQTLIATFMGPVHNLCATK